MSQGERWTVEIVCTDQGQHKRTWMTRFIWDPPDSVGGPSTEGWRSFILGPTSTHDMYGPPDPDSDPGSSIGHESYGFCCSRCPRWPKIKNERWIQLMEGARRGGLREFDVSRLD
jgi:hypothetical protein